MILKIETDSTTEINAASTISALMYSDIRGQHFDLASPRASSVLKESAVADIALGVGSAQIGFGLGAGYVLAIRVPSNEVSDLYDVGAKGSQYAMRDGVLYQRWSSMVMMRSVSAAATPVPALVHHPDPSQLMPFATV